MSGRADEPGAPPSPREIPALRERIAALHAGGKAIHRQLRDAAQRQDLRAMREWERIAPLLPPQKSPTGRPRHDHRTVLNGILAVVSTERS